MLQAAGDAWTPSPDFGSAGAPTLSRTRRTYENLDRVLKEMARLVREGRSDPRIRRKAVAITRSAGDMEDADGIARRIWRWVRANIRYVRDPAGVEYLQAPVATLQEGFADCDGQTVLAGALMGSVGVEVGFRAIAQRKNGQFDHVYLAYRSDAGTRFLDPTIPTPPGEDPHREAATSVKTVFLTSMSPNLGARKPQGRLPGTQIGSARSVPARTGGGLAQTQTTSTQIPEWWQQTVSQLIHTAPDLVWAIRGQLPPEAQQEIENQLPQGPDGPRQQPGFFGRMSLGEGIAIGGGILGLGWVVSQAFN